MAKSPLVNRIILAVSAIVLTSIVSMTATLTISKSIEGSATAINAAGALRMRANQLLTRKGALPAQPETSQDFAPFSAYESQLSTTAITSLIPDSSEHPLTRQHRLIINLWKTSLRPMMEAHPQGTQITAQMIAEVDRFTEEVNKLVFMLEERTEARIDLLHLIQIISLIFSVLIVVALFLDLKNRILRPLSKLVSIASAVGEQDFTQRANLKGSDELAQLGHAFDQMTSELALTYQELEDRAREKTEELEVSHTALQVMHATSRNLFANHDLCSGAIPMLQELEKILRIGPIKLYLHDKETDKPVEAVTTASQKRPFYCRDHHCNACLVTPEAFDELPAQENDGRRLLLPIRIPGQILGTLEVWYPADTDLPATSRRLLETLTDQLATAIFLEKQITEEQQQTLVEERTIIARELHDSLAQSLSYLKMQVTRLRRLNITGEHQAAHDDILHEFSTGLNSAYRQLRELLATFRLKLDTPDLASALNKTIDEFSERLTKRVEFEYTLPPQTLSPNEEIHTLQIVREALANAVKHANATDISVHVMFESPEVKALIRDNGKGLPDGSQPINHYGLIIMTDRARTLGGELKVENLATGGVEVSLTFIPKSRSLIPSQTSYA
ncbi:histidine kinase [Marinobacter sp. AL4B]|uniref:histidine kinase n=1 Tax=Marinobacter sp. AL4B TaxID=2871173 RepID=UPI001CAA4CAE|nr:histidine kinase [Marinobacter sp. AL4B]MBZ0334707.1 HAMP domain-containing protein [Marinobacter sp. AL4B]